jgi:RNA polymerase-binding transcription factor DksA
MPSAPARRAAPAPVLSAEQYSDLRSDLEAELRRLIPDAERLNERSLRDLAPRARRRALQIVAVLRRMGTDTFGVCVSCRSPIAYERLSAIPETTVCARCSWSYEVSLQG